MKTYKAKEPAKWGVYLAINHFDLRTVNAGGEILDGPQGARYVRLPTLLVAALSPVLGGLFVLFFPVLIFAAVIAVGAELIVRAGRRTWARHAHLRRLRWEPMVANLDRKEEIETITDPRERAAFQELEDEVRQRRQTELKKVQDENKSEQEKH